MIAFHRPLYPSVGGHLGFTEGIDAWMPTFRAHAGRILLTTGHNHALSRERVDGVDMVTAGGGGAPLYGCTRVHLDTRFCRSVYGYFVCDDSLRCVAYEVDPQTGEETVVDAFSVGP